MKKYILFFALIFTIGSINSQENVTFKIQDSIRPIEYSEVWIRNIYFLSDINGSLVIKKSELNIGDTVLVKVLGYEDKILVIDNTLLSANDYKITLKEKKYALGEVVVSKDFDAKIFYLNKVKDIKLYPSKHEVHISAEISFPDSLNNYKIKRLYKKFDVKRKGNKYTFPLKSSKENDRYKELYGISYQCILAFHHIKMSDQYNFKFEYLGMENSLHVFSMTEKNVEENGRYYILAYMDSDGHVVKVEEESISYSGPSIKIIVECELYRKNYLVPKYIYGIRFLPQNIIGKKNITDNEESGAKNNRIESLYTNGYDWMGIMNFNYDE